MHQLSVLVKKPSSPKSLLKGSGGTASRDSLAACSDNLPFMAEGHREYFQKLSKVPQVDDWSFQKTVPSVGSACFVLVW